MGVTGFAAFGFLLGLRHAVEADHVAAVASLSARNTSLAQAVRVGTFWGVGHTLTLFLFGGIVLLADTIVPEQLAWALELAVGVMLIALGIDVLLKLIRGRFHLHVHRHDDGTTHFHAHSHAGSEDHDHAHEHAHAHAHRFPVRALLVGLMHGLAGSAALVLLAVSNAPSVATGLLYIAVFGLGSIFGMAILSVAIAVPLRYSARTMTWFHHGLQGVIGVATIALGASVIYELALR